MTTEPTEPTGTSEPREADTAASKDEAAIEQAPGLSFLATTGIAAFCSAVAVVVGLVVYAAFFEKETRLATVDIEEILELKQLELASMVFGKKLTDEERALAQSMAEGFGQRLDAALELVQKECGCVLLAAGAIVKGDAVNMTEQVKEKLGLKGLNQKQLQKSIQDRLGNMAPEIGKQE